MDDLNLKLEQSNAHLQQQLDELKSQLNKRPSPPSPATNVSPNVAVVKRPKVADKPTSASASSSFAIGTTSHTVKSSVKSSVKSAGTRSLLATDYAPPDVSTTNSFSTLAAVDDDAAAMRLVVHDEVVSVGTGVDDTRADMATSRDGK